MEPVTKNLPVIAMRGLNVFPRMNTSFDLERPISVHALERAMENGEEIFLVTQREIGVEQPEEKDLYEIGTVARVTQILRVSDRVLRVMVLGIPNVGKSTFINKVSGRKSAKAEDRPGVTRTKQWVPVDKTLELLDTPGILWPKFEDSSVGVRLAFTGAIRDEVVDIEELAMRLMDYLGKNYPKAIEERYKLTVSEEDDGYALLEKAGRKRGFLISGGEVDTERMSRILLDEFRGGKLGRFTLEFPPEGERT